MAELVKVQVCGIEDICSSVGTITQKKIMVRSAYSSELDNPKEAYPPSAIYFDVTGSSMHAIPPEGSEAWAIKETGSNTLQIITFVPRPGMNPWGEYLPTDIPDGGFQMGLGGRIPIRMTMSKPGKLEIFSDNFCNIEMDGKAKSYKADVKLHETFFAGGYCSDGYRIRGLELPAITEHVELYTRTDETSKLPTSDRETATETRSALPPYLYIDKVLIKAGSIKSSIINRQAPELTHLYEIDTRQAINSTDKTTVTDLKLGYQSDGYRFNDTILYSAGTLYEFRAKHKDETQMFNTYSITYGKLTGGKAMGESYRKQIYNGLSLTATPLDPLAEGRGYDFDDRTANEIFVESFGKLLDDQTIYRRIIQDKIGTFDVRESYGGEDYYNLKLTSPTSKYNIKFGMDNTITITINNSSPTQDPLIKLSPGKININPGSIEGTNIFIGNETGGNYLVTANWVKQIFNNHFHPASPGTTGPPALPPVGPESSKYGNPTNLFTNQLKAH